MDEKKKKKFFFAYFCQNKITVVSDFLKGVVRVIYGPKCGKKGLFRQFFAFFGLFSTFRAINNPNYPLKEIGDDSALILAKISKKIFFFFSSNMAPENGHAVFFFKVFWTFLIGARLWLGH